MRTPLNPLAVVALLFAVTALGGCATLRTLPPPDLTPAHQLTVFTDGFHSGVALDRASLPAGFDPVAGDRPASWPLITVHFGEQRWTDGEDTSCLHAASLFFIPGAGVVQSDHTRPGLIDVPGLHLDHLRTWTFVVDQAGMDHLVATLRGHWLDGRIMTRSTGETSSLYPTLPRWSVFHSCHDFTVAMVRAAGLDLRGRWLYLAGGLANDLDDASRELSAAGIRVIGVVDEPGLRNAGANAQSDP